jgi:hypothetical protein
LPRPEVSERIDFLSNFVLLFITKRPVAGEERIGIWCKIEQEAPDIILAKIQEDGP